MIKERVKKYSMWSEEDEEFLKNNYSKYTCVTLGNLLGKKPKAVRDKANYIGLYKFAKQVLTH